MVMNLRVPKNAEDFESAEQLLASEETLCYMESGSPKILIVERVISMAAIY
jgi:hypothetical protein